jgi:Berberine and berberine like
VDALVDVAREAAESPLATLEIKHLGGAIGRPHAAHGALTSIDAPYLMFAAGMAPVPKLEAGMRTHLRAVKAALGPWAASRTYLNFDATHGDAARFWRAPVYHRLRRIKATVDPDDLIRSNHPVPAAHTTTGTDT